MPDFWRNSGFHLLQPAADKRLAINDEFLRAYIRRPELRPPDDADESERRLHAALLDQPRRTVTAQDLAALTDADARDNYTLLLAFRDRLIKAGTVEDAYLGLFTDPGTTPTPPLFMDQLAHIAIRGILDGVEDPLRARAAELFFRSQKVTIRDGSILVADEETVEMYAATGGLGSLGKLLVEAKTPTREVELDVLNETNAEIYWSRDERHDTVLELTFGRAGLDALARVLEAWVRHFLGIEVSIQPVARIQDEKWVWHVGLDAEASAIMNDLYAGKDVDEDRLKRILGLFRLEFADPSVMTPSIAGRPVYLGIAQDAQERLRLKPQNLLVNLPLHARS